MSEWAKRPHTYTCAPGCCATFGRLRRPINLSWRSREASPEITLVVVVVVVPCKWGCCVGEFLVESRPSCMCVSDILVACSLENRSQVARNH